MKRICLRLLLMFAAIGSVACEPHIIETVEPGATLLPPVTPGAPLGSAIRVQDTVEHAREGQPLQTLLDEAELHPNHQIAVKDGGEALLDFKDAMRVILFNNSGTTVTTQVAEGAPLVVHFVLWRGGLVGEKPLDDTRRVELDTPAGAKITIIATIFFVTYDANSEITAVGNFEGTVNVFSGGVPLVVPDNSYVVIGAGDPPGAPQPLFLDADGFAERARQLNSPLAVVEELQQTRTPTPGPTATGTAPATTTPTSSPSNTPVHTPIIPTATFTLNANCRRGPGTLYEVLGVYSPGDRLLVTGRNTEASWWQLDAGGFTCWAADSVLAVENGGQVPVVPAPPLPPTPTSTPTPTPTLTPTPTPSPSPTPTPTFCRPPSVTVNATSTTVSWSTVGGCAPFTGTLTGRYSHERTYFLTEPISQPSDFYNADPPIICEGTFTIIYTVTLLDNAGQQTLDSASVEVTYVC